MRKGDVNNDLDVQGEYLLQFGRYRGQSFRWMLENALGYAGWFVDNTRNEKVTQSAISQNKAAFKGYVESFEEGREVVAMKTKQREDKEVKLRRQVSIPAQEKLPPHLQLQFYLGILVQRNMCLVSSRLALLKSSSQRSQHEKGSENQLL